MRFHQGSHIACPKSHKISPIQAQISQYVHMHSQCRDITMRYFGSEFDLISTVEFWILALYQSRIQVGRAKTPFAPQKQMDARFKRAMFNAYQQSGRAKYREIRRKTVYLEGGWGNNTEFLQYIFLLIFWIVHIRNDFRGFRLVGFSRGPLRDGKSPTMTNPSNYIILSLPYVPRLRAHIWGPPIPRGCL